MDLKRIVKEANIEKFTPLDAAERQIDRAITLFIEERDYLCAVTLACAAEGILGEALLAEKREPIVELLKSELKGTPLFSQLSSKELSDQHLNKLRNLLKHFSGDLNAEIDHVTDLEAFISILRAIGNFALLTERVSQKSVEFFDWLKQSRPEILEEAAKYDQQSFTERLFESDSPILGDGITQERKD